MRHSRFIAGAAAGAVLASAVAVVQAQPVGEGWLMGAETDVERWDLLHDDLAGFSRTMWEVGYRFREMHAAIEDGHLELAAHHWDSLGSAIENGLVRRPGRAENANRVLMTSVYGEVEAALEGGDQAQAEAAFMSARNACMECHVAEERSYLNDQRIFRLGF